ncbi:wnt family domain-containing protein [Ditylenchus destructor]|uniref:Protein Wnt n=1 Tax=Ditylenchus destructor TaxID=166010 RepID=A0AAD4NF25_9BILA|nr:wnt family domain-containing protein [Ditylenchus destructor]
MRLVIKTLGIFFFGIILAVVDSSISWLAMSLTSTAISKNRPAAICRSLPGLTRRQIKFCRRNLESMETIRFGAREAYTECQYQFHKRRWNCTMIDPETNKVYGDVILKEGTREAAFVHAISAAGVAYRITKDCSRGIAVSAEFVDGAEKHKNQSQERRLMNEHNNRAGREVLASSLRRECKCHGVSGACEMRTCWDAMPPFREVGNIIKDKFDGATEVSIVSNGESKPRMERKNPMFKRHTPADLVYLDSSPDYCEPDAERGVLGTKGRQCNISSLAIDGCDLLCCHRGYNRNVQIVKERCHCKFHYCCRVECQTCEKIVETYTCK